MVKKTIKKRTRKHKKTRIMRKRRIMGGECGCKNSLFSGGNINPVSFNGSLPIKYYYPQNNFTNDHSDSAFVESSRNLPNFINGGKKSRKMKKIKGGDMLMGSAYVNNPLLTFGTIDGARNSVDILYGNSSTNPSVFDQPILKGFSNTNPPLA